MKNKKMLLYKKIMVTVVSSGMLLLPNWGYALPQGGQVVGGSGSIGSPGGGAMDITGTGGNLAIDWDSFNIAQGETVNFKNMQAVLNYVTGSQRSGMAAARMSSCSIPTGSCLVPRQRSM